MTQINDPNTHKSELEEEAKALEKDIKAEFNLMQKHVKKQFIKALLIAGGTLAVVSVLKLLLSDDKKSNKKEAESDHKKSKASMRLKSIILPLILQLAKFKVLDIINSKSEKNPNDPAKTD